MRRTLFVLVAVTMLACTGCGHLLKVTQTKQTPIPVAPRQPHELVETMREQTAYARDVLELVWLTGARAGNEAVRQAADAAGSLETIMGSPIRRFDAMLDSAGQPAPIPMDRFEAWLERAGELLEAHRMVLADFDKKLDVARAEQAGTPAGTTVTSPWLRFAGALGGGSFVTIIVILGIVLFLAPKPTWALLKAVGAALGAIIGWVFTRSSRALSQTVTAIEAARDKMPAEAVEALETQLRKAQTKETKTLVAKLRVDAKEQLARDAPSPGPPSPSSASAGGKKAA